MMNTFKRLFAIGLIAGMLMPLLSSAYPGQIIKKFSTPGNFPTGMTFDGEHIWLADRKDQKIYCMDPATGMVIRSIPSPGYWPTGLAWDGEALWAADVKGGLPLSENYQGMIYKLSPVDGRVLKVIPAPTDRPRDLAWDGTYLWCVDEKADEIIQFSPDDGTTIKTLRSPANDPRGLAFDGRYLWVSDRMQDEIYMVDPDNGQVLIIADAPGAFTRGLAWDGEYIWAVDSQEDEFYCLTAKDEDLFVLKNERKARVSYTHMLTNFGPGKMLSADIHVAIPRNRDNQIIEHIQYQPGYSIVTDKSGQQTAHYSFNNVKAGAKVEAELVTTASIYEIRYFIYPDKVGGLDEIPDDIKDVYFQDNEKYQLSHPIIQGAVEQAIGDEKNPYWIARKIYNFLMGEMYYEMVGGWNTAPTVLERGNGSCSEYTFVFISMCRAAGLPARYVGAVVVRGDDDCMDDVFHRWVEVYLPNYGWIPVDPSGGDQKLPRNQANYFGHLSNRFLITTESAGGSATMGWTYNSNDFYTTEPKTFVVSDHFADWKPLK
jgi:transglutaminase-like putative cysteine protease/outer membrane protein assembly factor BamB